MWEWYAWRRRTVAACEPNEAHLALARRAARDPGLTIATQNVDALHDDARRRVEGTERDGVDPADRLLELHGSLFRSRCTGCGRRQELRGEVDASDRGTLPRCEECHALLRPDVVWFGEALPRDVLEAAADAARSCRVCLVVGTSSVVQPAASLALEAARSGATVIEVNPEETPLTPRADLRLAARAAEALPRLLGP